MTTLHTNEYIGAIFDDDAEAVVAFLAAGARLSADSRHGNTPIRTACQGNACRALRVLLSHGANPNERITYRSPVDKRIEENFTPLMYAASREIAEILIEWGADVNASSTSGVTPLMRAARFAHLEVVELLLEKGADKSAQTPKRRGKRSLTAREISQDALEFWLSLPREGLKPEAENYIRRHKATLELLGGASDS